MGSPRDALVEVVARRAVEDALTQAVEALADGGSAKAVHAARKACKRARATLRLVGGRAAREVEEQIAAGARLLSEVRDGDVLRSLVAAHGLPVALPAPPDRERAAREARAALTAASVAAEALRYERLDVDAVEAGLTRSWRSARRAMRAAEAALAAGQETAEVFHTWRKRVKRLQAQCALVADRYPALGSHAPQLDGLQEALGTLHDLAVLRGLAPDGTRELQDEVTAYEQRALGEGRVALALRPREFAAALQR